jgi:protoheme ferro-lyase
MTIEEIHKLCDEADAIDSGKYFALCEADNTEEEFIEGLKEIIRSRYAEG